MASVTFTFNPTPAPACYPADMNGLAQQLTTGGMLSGTIPDNAGGGVFVGQAQPSSANTTKVWFRVDAAGRPIGVYQFYNGNWRKVYTNVGLGEIRMWSGTNAVFDSSGRGVVGGDMDGWALCNGQNGTPDLSNRFIVGSSQFAGGWQSNPDGQGAGFSGGTGVIKCINLPDLFAQATLAKVASGTVVEVASPSGPDGPWDISVQDIINGCHPAGQVPLVPPWYAFAFIEFVGYL